MRGAVEVVVWEVVLALLWLATTSSVSVQESVAAVVFALPCAVAATAARRAAGGHWRPNRSWLRWLLVLPWAVLRDTAAVLVHVVRRDDGEFTRVGLPHDPAEAQRTAREALAAGALSATPATVVADANGKGLVVHRLPGGYRGLERRVGR